MDFLATEMMILESATVSKMLGIHLSSHSHIFWHKGEMFLMVKEFS